MSLWAFVCSVHLCISVRNRTHPLDEMTHKQLAGEFFLSRRVFFSLTEHTEFTEPFGALFRAHRTPSAYRVHRALLLKVAVRFCEIGWLNVSVGPCVFCSSVYFCEKKNIFETRRGFFSLTEITDLTELFCALFNSWGVFSLTERTEFTEHFGAQFRAHRRPSAYRVHRAL